jgi:hypothetical protein
MSRRGGTRSPRGCGCLSLPCLPALFAEQPLAALLGKPLLAALLKTPLSSRGQPHRDVLGCGEFTQQRLTMLAKRRHSGLLCAQC